VQRSVFGTGLGLSGRFSQTVLDQCRSDLRPFRQVNLAQTRVAGYPAAMSSELLILPSAYRHNITEEAIRHALANVIDVFENQGDIPLTMITGPADHEGENVIEVGFEVSDTGNVVVYHAMNARPKYR